MCGQVGLCQVHSLERSRCSGRCEKGCFVKFVVTPTPLTGPSVNPPLSATLDHQTRIGPRVVCDLASVRRVPSSPPVSTVSRFSNVDGVPTYPRNRFRFWWSLHIWQLNSSSLFIVLTIKTHHSHCNTGLHFQRDHPAKMFPKFQRVHLLHVKLMRRPHHCWFSIPAHGDLCRTQRAHTLCKLLDCMWVRCSL